MIRSDQGIERPANREPATGGGAGPASRRDYETSRLIVHALDADGCLLGRRDENRGENLEAYLKSPSQKNSRLLSFSSRVSHTSDQKNATRNDNGYFIGPSGYLAGLGKRINREVDTALLADVDQEGEHKTWEDGDPQIYQDNQEAHKAFSLSPEQARDLMNEIDSLDDNKQLLLYFNVHRLAADNPSKTIIFNIYDDKPDILNALNKFYKNNTRLLPDTVRIKFHHYAYGQFHSPDETSQEFARANRRSTGSDRPPASIEIPGTGPCNENYIQTLKKTRGEIHDICVEAWDEEAERAEKDAANFKENPFNCKRPAFYKVSDEDRQQALKVALYDRPRLSIYHAVRHYLTTIYPNGSHDPSRCNAAKEMIATLNDFRKDNTAVLNQLKTICTRLPRHWSVGLFSGGSTLRAAVESCLREFEKDPDNSQTARPDDTNPSDEERTPPAAGAGGR